MKVFVLLLLFIQSLTISAQCNLGMGSDSAEVNSLVRLFNFSKDFERFHSSVRNMSTKHFGTAVDGIIYNSVLFSNKKGEEKSGEFFHHKLFEGKVIGCTFCYRGKKYLKNRLKQIEKCKQWERVGPTIWVDKVNQFRLKVKEPNEEYKEKNPNGWSHFIYITLL